MSRMRFRRSRETDLPDREKMQRVRFVGRRILRPHLIGLLMRRSAARKKYKARENGASPGLLFLVAPRGVEPLILG